MTPLESAGSLRRCTGVVGPFTLADPPAACLQLSMLQHRQRVALTPNQGFPHSPRRFYMVKNLFFLPIAQ